MDPVFSLAFSFLILIATSIYLLIPTLSFRRLARLPPGPCPLPVIGNILQLGQKPHQSLARLAKIYGPLMSLKLGCRITIVVSSPTIAREVLQKHDQVLSGRTTSDAVHVLDHHKHSIVWLPASTQWRNLRKMIKEQMFAAQRLDCSKGLRQEKIQGLCDYLHSCSTSKEAANIGEAAFTTSLKLISTTLFSVDFASYGSNSSQELKEIVWSLMKIAGAPNLADYLPALKLMDPQGIRRQAEFYFLKLFDKFGNIINQRRLERNSSDSYSRKGDILEVLLDRISKDESEFSSNDLKHLLIDLFLGGTETTAITVEWTMAELLRDPQKMAKARAELNEVIGQKEKVEESDISRLPYLQAVVKETFRLHPPGPLLVPHKAETNVEINGYIVPKNADIIVNIWAYSRDPGIWSNPETFIPERFLQSEIDVRGQHFELIPFGAGRRICPGLPLAHRMVHLMLASLIHNFEWKLEEGTEPKDIDMEDKFGLSVQKAVPLKAIPVSLVRI